MLVVVHVFIFRERSTIMSAMETVSDGAAAAAAAAPAKKHKDNWYLQIVDLDLAWAHGVLGLGDWYLCMLGLIYGLVVIAFSLFVMQAVVTNSPAAKSQSRFFMMFLHLELFLYIALVTVKLPLLCKIKHHFLTLMDEDCNVLRFMFAERAISRVIIGSLCCWVFSSFAYLLAWGDAGVDDATIGDEMPQGQRFQQYHGSRQQVSPQGAYPQPSAYLPAAGYPNRASFAASSVVGDAVSVSSRYEPRWASGKQASFAIQSGVHPERGSFAHSNVAGGGRYGAQPQYIMPRADSSIQSNVSQQAAERQMLIKPPIVIH